ncbi:MAG: B12-binding domain-containing radical SAM protein, partial [Deltaproteobacteria bacterium RBG_13_58_19]
MINPPFKPEHGRFSRSSRSPAVAKSGTFYYPFWLAYATGVLEKEGFEARLIDAPAAGSTAAAVLHQARAFAPGLAVLDTSTPSIISDVSFAAALKAALPETFILLVGTHPSALPTETLNLERSIDAVAIGEYDYTVRDLARALHTGGDLRGVEGLALREGEQIVFTPPRPYIDDLDEIPFVSAVYQKHLHYRHYFESMARHPMVMLISGRGCPFRCFFCVYPQVFHGHKYRLRSPENVVAEFAYILENFPEVQEIGIEDDTFTANLNRVREICRLLIREGIHRRVKWWANARVNLDLETMKLMQEAGCRLLIPGFESGDQAILNNMSKAITLEQSRQYVADAKKAGLLVHGCFMVGNPGETRETMLSTLNFAKELDLDTAQFYPLIPYPGTRAYKWAREQGCLKTENYEEWLTPEGLHNTVISLPGLSDRELVEFCDYARRAFYLRPRYLGQKFVQSLRSWQEA